MIQFDVPTIFQEVFESLRSTKASAKGLAQKWMYRN